MAAAFSWLILLSVLLVNGTSLFTSIMRRITPPQPTTGGGGGGSIKKN